MNRLRGAGSLGGHSITEKDVLRRLRNGHRLELTYGREFQSRFVKDGTPVPHEVMEGIARKGLARPLGNAVGVPWELTG